jgi:adenosylhomocysteine nucleosidase
MALAIMAAMHEELSALLELLPDERRERVAGREFWMGQLRGREVVAVRSGIGKVAAATTATLAIHRFGAQALLFTGVAGGLGEGVRVGDLVVATELLQHDMDASPIFPRHELPCYGLSRLPSDVAMSARLHQAALCVAERPERHLGDDALGALGIGAPAVHRGLIVSGDRFVSSAAESQALHQELPDALAVEMEGAAVAQVCHDHGLPFAVVRTISDRADAQAHVDFTAFLQRVAGRYSAALVDGYLALS